MGNATTVPSTATLQPKRWQVFSNVPKENGINKHNNKVISNK